MPNLKQSLNIKQKYGGGTSDLTKSKLETLLEAFDPNRIEKAFSFNTTVDKYQEYFKKRKKVKVILLFIDVTSFSTKFKSKTTEEVAAFLDSYYEKVFPYIVDNGGEIEKVMGDGIICVFGEPFLNDQLLALHRKAEKCATSIIRNCKGTEFESKIALHYGEVMYYQNPTCEYYEYTMIGNALTELFRLESIASNNSISYYTDTPYDKINIDDVSKGISGSTGVISWSISNPVSIDLPGVSYKEIRHLEKV